MPGTVVCFTTERKLVQEQFPSPENPDCFLAILLGDHSGLHEQINFQFEFRLIRHESFSLFTALSSLSAVPTHNNLFRPGFSNGVRCAKSILALDGRVADELRPR